MKQSARQYGWRMAIAATLYSVSVIGINLADARFELPIWGLVLLSLLPILPALGMLAAMVIFVRAMDEVQRRIVTESVLIAAIIVAFASFTYGFLQGAVDLPAISLIWVLPALIATQGIAMIFVRRWYQ